MASNAYSTHRNYHFHFNSASNGTSYNFNNIYNNYSPPKGNSNPQTTIGKNLLMQNQNVNFQNQLRNINSFYGKQNSNVIGTSKYTLNINPSSTMNLQERVIAFGQDKDENFFKRTLRKPINSNNAIQLSSYNIINNLPYNSGGLYGNSTNRFENSYNQKRTNYSTRQNYPHSLYQPNTGRASSSSKQQNIKKIDNINSVISGLNSNSAIVNNVQQMRPQTQTTLNQPSQLKGNNSNSNIQIKKEEKISEDIPEYYESNAIAVIEYSYKEEQNAKYRGYMEDKGKAIDCFKNNPHDALFCLFDGHGGVQVSKYLQENFHKEFTNVLPNDNIESTMISLFQSIDENIKNSEFASVGSTACVVYITKENGKRILYCANIGDTRCVLLSTIQAKRLSYDDRANDKNEYERIINAGGIVFDGRVYGALMLSRAFGDWELKPYGVINVPHVIRMEISDSDKYIIMGSDGIWDVLTDDDVYTMSLKSINSNELCKDIINTSLEKGTMDNISCFVIRIN